VAIALAAAVVALAASAFGIVFEPDHGHGEGDPASASETLSEPGHSHGEGDREGEAHAAHAESGERDSEAESEGVAGKVAGALLISLAAVALVPWSIRARREHGSGPRMTAAVAPAQRLPLAGTLLAVLGMISAGAAAVHFAVIGPHFEEWWLEGTFFILLGLLQLAWAVLIVWRPSRILVLAAAVGNAAVVAVWVVSRTAGVPLGPEAGEPEAVGFADTLATVYELLIVAGSVALLRGLDLERVRGWRASAVGPALGLVVISLTAVALLSLVQL
jgi:hypothetical protein